jgi:hypothetical protein
MAVPAVAAPAHAADDAMRFQQSLKVLTGVLRTPVGMMQYRLWPASSEDGHQQCPLPAACHRGLHRPAHDTSRIKVEHHCNKQPAFRRPDISEVSCPFLVWCFCLKMSLHQVGRHRMHDRYQLAWQSAPLVTSLDSSSLHQAGYLID